MIRQFYTSQDSTYQKSAQEYLHNLQKESFAWELAPHLLSSQVIKHWIPTHVENARLGPCLPSGIAFFLSFQAHIASRSYRTLYRVKIVNSLERIPTRSRSQETGMIPSLLGRNIIGARIYIAFGFDQLTIVLNIENLRQTIPEDRIEWMRGELIRWIVRYSNGPAFIRTKLCLAVS